jgi:hypothetical protein
MDEQFHIPQGFLEDELIIPCHDMDQATMRNTITSLAPLISGPMTDTSVKTDAVEILCI